MPTDVLLSTTEVAQRMGVTRQTVLNWIISGRLPAKRTPGGRYRVDVADTAMPDAEPRPRKAVAS